ncbi:hypothetical protein OSH10_18670 [Kaistia defluvii]|uniref:hypothetical protein n=1 Tax=Kaistia defluvii TaxID=410841 RepID=UPI002259DD1E|nr:hypothetical protein [Kaistia defluvii]MCX5520468.1 hypothetical protein [Kaistia defluvii]
MGPHIADWGVPHILVNNAGSDSKPNGSAGAGFRGMRIPGFAARDGELMDITTNGPVLMRDITESGDAATRPIPVGSTLDTAA